MNQIISIVSLTLYLWYEYYENNCFELICLFSEKEISGSKIVKPDVVPTIILIIIFCVQFWRIFIYVKWLEWFSFKDKLDRSRVFYPQKHARLMRSGFGRGHDFSMNRHRLQQGEYLNANLEELEKRQDAEEERFNEMHIYFGQ